MTAGSGGFESTAELVSRRQPLLLSALGMDATGNRQQAAMPTRGRPFVGGEGACVRARALQFSPRGEGQNFPLEGMSHARCAVTLVESKHATISLALLANKITSWHYKCRRHPFAARKLLDSPECAVKRACCLCLSRLDNKQTKAEEEGEGKRATRSPCSIDRSPRCYSLLQKRALPAIVSRTSARPSFVVIAPNQNNTVNQVICCCCCCSYYYYYYYLIDLIGFDTKCTLVSLVNAAVVVALKR